MEGKRGAISLPTTPPKDPPQAFSLGSPSGFSSVIISRPRLREGCDYIEDKIILYFIDPPPQIIPSLLSVLKKEDVVRLEYRPSTPPCSYTTQSLHINYCIVVK